VLIKTTFNRLWDWFDTYTDLIIIFSVSSILGVLGLLFINWVSSYDDKIQEREKIIEQQNTKTIKETIEDFGAIPIYNKDRTCIGHIVYVRGKTVFVFREGGVLVLKEEKQ